MAVSILGSVNSDRLLLERPQMITDFKTEDAPFHCVAPALRPLIKHKSYGNRLSLANHQATLSHIEQKKLSPSWQRIGLLYNPRVDASCWLAHELACIAESMGCEAWVESAWAEERVVAQVAAYDLIVTLGGDGTILRVVRAALENKANQAAAVPIFTIDYGTLGFLAELTPDQATTGFRQLLAGNFWIEERGLLQATLVRNGKRIAERLALNEVVLGCSDRFCALGLTLLIDDIATADYVADALIIASPTGSTAYAMAAGGPILSPTLPGLLAVPVAPHLAAARSFVIPHTSRITLKASQYKKSMVTLDGQVALPFEADDLLHITYSHEVARFARVSPQSYFYATLNDKLRRA